MSAKMMEAWPDKGREEALERDLIEGCRAMWDINVELEQEFHPLEEEVARAENERGDKSLSLDKRPPDEVCA